MPTITDPMVMVTQCPRCKSHTQSCMQLVGTHIVLCACGMSGQESPDILQAVTSWNNAVAAYEREHPNN